MVPRESDSYTSGVGINTGTAFIFLSSSSFAEPEARIFMPSTSFSVVKGFRVTTW